MPKAEKGTPKDIANRMKAKGLQKLKFYCQMCQKQCRDQNGFKCHLTSESHLRQMKIFSGNASGIVNDMSKEFETSYVETLRRRHGTKRVNANNVYQEVIQDRHHIHMNATKWAALTDFVQYLGKMGTCVVDETERGWYVQYIERDAEILARQEAQQRRVEAEKVSEQQLAKQMEIQRIEAAKALDRAGGTLKAEATKLDRNGTEATISLRLGAVAARKKPSTLRVAQKSILASDDDDDNLDALASAHGNVQRTSSLSPHISNTGKRRPATEPSDKRASKCDAFFESTAPSKRHRENAPEFSRSETWLLRNILVRIISKELAGGKFFMRKAIVERVLHDKFAAEVEVLDSGPNEQDGGDVIRLDQDDLETVVPKEGKTVRILNGRSRGKRAKVVALDKKKYRAVLRLEDGVVLEGVDYGDFSKQA